MFRTKLIFNKVLKNYNIHFVVANHPENITSYVSEIFKIIFYFLKTYHIYTKSLHIYNNHKYFDLSRIRNN